MVPDVGCNMFSITSKTELVATAIFALSESQTETNGFTISLTQAGWCRDLYTFNVELGRRKLALHAEVDADRRHSRLRHINTRSLELLIGSL